MPAETFGAWSLVPPLLAIVLAIITRKAVLSLFLGVWSGGLIFTYPDSFDLVAGPLENAGLSGTVLEVVAGFIAIFVAGLWGIPQGFEWIAEAIGDSVFHANILIFTLLLGSAVAMIWRLGGSYAVRDWALERIENQRQAGLWTLALGLLMFFDDYANTAIVGSTMKDVSDKMRISKEKFSYIVDSTAAPVATLALSSWVAFQISMIDAGYEAIPDDDIVREDIPPLVEIFLQSIPFNMYSVLAIVMVGIIVYTGRDYAEMLTAEHRSWSTGLVSRKDARPMLEIEDDLGEPNIDNPRLSVFFLPVVVLIVVTLVAAAWTAWPEATEPWELITEAWFDVALVIGSFAMVASTYVLAYRYDLLSLRDGVDTTIDGFGLMLTAVSILVLAWSIGEVVSALGTGEYVGDFAEAVLIPELLPVVVLVIAAFIAFSTGTSWGTMAIVTPIAIPVTWSLVPGEHTFVAVIVGAIFSGAIFGDHSSPISDTSVLSATFTGADLIDHVRTQLYYAVTVALVAMAMLLIWAFGATSVWGMTILPAVGLLVLGAVILAGLVYAFSEFDANRKGVEPRAVEAAQDEPTDADVADD